MIEKIRELEKTARQLHLDIDSRTNITAAAEKYAGDFLDKLEESPAFVESNTKSRELLQYPIEEEGKTMEEILELFEKYVDGAGLNAASGGHLAYIPGGGVYPAALGDYLAAVTNRYAGLFFSCPGAVRMENMLIRWMCQLMGYPDSALGNLTSGGSIANLIAIVTARDFHEITADKVKRSVIYLTEQVHHCVQKAIRIAGLRECKHRYVPLDGHFRMDAIALLKMVEEDQADGLIPFMVVGSVGTTDTGAVDPIDDIAHIAKQYNLWLHIDAAYGGFFVLTPEARDKFKGVEKSDSLAMDPHKGLFLPYGLGAVLIKNVEAQWKSHYYKASYLQDVIDDLNEPSPADLSPELTKHFRAVRLWLPLQLYGLHPFRAALSEKIMLCRYFYEKVQELGFQVGPYPELSVMIYRYIPEMSDANFFNAAVVEAVREDGRVFLSSTTINGVFWIRLAVLNFRTHLHTIDLALEVLKNAIERVSKELEARIA